MLPSKTIENPPHTSKLPQPYKPPTTNNQEIISKPPTLSCLGKPSGPNNRYSLNVDSSLGKAPGSEGPAKRLPRIKPQKVESLVLANQQGKYVGTKHLKPVSGTRFPPATQAPGKAAGPTDPQRTLGRRQREAPSSAMSSIPTVFGQERKSNVRRGLPSKKCM